MLVVKGIKMDEYFSIKWFDGSVRMLDQRLLPDEIVYLDFIKVEEVAQAIKEMVIRGAPAIGTAAGYGLALATSRSEACDVSMLKQEISDAADILRESRPTAINLAWSIDRISKKIEQIETVDEIRKLVIMEADLIAAEDIEANRQMGIHALPLIPDKSNIIHHCNTGALATTGYGTAQGVIRAAHEHGKNIHVFVDETRPRLQGSKLTVWELKQLGIPYTVIVDGASGYFMLNHRVDLCLVGCDRIAANGDVANKIGTYNLALAAYAHQIPFYVVGPTSTIDMETLSGEEIPIEERPKFEITHLGNSQIISEDTIVANPAFDITPAKYISAIITERGIIFPPYIKNLAEVMAD
jgi:methylthioribose-1-phosphate isomerase